MHLEENSFVFHIALCRRTLRRPKRCNQAAFSFAYIVAVSGLARLAFQLDSGDLGSRLSCAVGAKTLAAQDGPAARRLEWHGIGFATLIAGDLKSLAFASSSWSTKIGTARIPARLAAFGMG
jgi:hypothetical protein